FGALVSVCRTPETSGFGAVSPRMQRGANGASAARGAGNKSAKKSTVQRHAVAPRAADFGQRTGLPLRPTSSVFLAVRPSAPFVLAHAVRGEAKQAPCRSVFRRHSSPASGAGCKPVIAGHRIPVHVQVCLENTPSRPGWIPTNPP